MKKLFFLFMISHGWLQAQVGISSNPNYVPPAGTQLSVEGNITVRDKIYAGGNSTTLGNPGKAGQVLVSQGPDLPPKWRTLNIPNVEENSYYLIYNNSFKDLTGVDINNAADTNNGNGPFPLDTPRNDSRFNLFSTITGLTQPFTVNSGTSQVYITFEAVAHSNSNGNNNGADFVCGIFAGGNTTATRRLKGIRKLTLQQSYGASSQTFITYTQIALASGLAVGDHTVEVACKRTATYGTLTQLGIGKSSSGNLNNFTNQSSLKVEVYEIPDMNNGTNIIDFIP